MFRKGDYKRLFRETKLLNGEIGSVELIEFTYCT